MSLLKNLTTNKDIAPEQDRVGGGATLFDSGIFKFNIALAYLQKSSGGALGLFLTLKSEDGRELKQAMYLTGGDAKGNKNTFLDKDNNEQYLPGFNSANSLALLTNDKELSELDTDIKTVAIYNFEAKSEVPTKVEVVTDLMGKDVYAGVIRQKVDKRKKNDATGQYEATGETREENEIDKFFCAIDGYEFFTSAELAAKKQDESVEPVFHNTWKEANEGKVRDKTGKGGPKAGAPGAGSPAAAAAGKPSKSLFSKG